MKTHPLVAMNFRDTCKYAPVIFTATETTTSIGINQWYWRFGDGTSLTGNPVTHQYNNNGQYQVQLYGISTEGCSSDTLKASINIYGTNAFAGYDTIAAANQPVRLQASGGISYSWSPPEGLSATDVYNPIATIPQDKTYYLKAFTPEGCESYDTINIKIYKGPEIYVPTAFTPDGDQLNDILHPIPIGIKQFLQFSIYNRYGQLVFSTDNPERGWDGHLKGVVQQGTFVWMASAIDFRGKPLFRKGTVMIIR
jgi:gliding motility-associated-like protein